MLAKLFPKLFLLMILTPVKGDATKELLNNMSSQSTLKPNSDDVPIPGTSTWEVNPILNSMWLYRPSVLSPKELDPGVHKVSLKEPYAVSRLAKSLTFGFDPYFNKGYFEPFERRRRPVTLVTFRKNGWLPKEDVQMENSKSAEVAEMQSPFNEISSFWQNEPGSF